MLISMYKGDIRRTLTQLSDRHLNPQVFKSRRSHEINLQPKHPKDYWKDYWKDLVVLRTPLTGSF